MTADSTQPSAATARRFSPGPDDGDEASTDIQPLAAAPPPEPRSAAWPSADLIKADLIAADYSPEEIGDVLWLLDYARSNAIQNYKALAADLNFDGDSTLVSRCMRGKYGGEAGGSRGPFFAKVRAFRHVLTERIDFGAEPFVETQVWADVCSLCDLARVSATMGMIWGPNQSGKTRALKRYAELNNHGRTIYVRMPVGGSARMSLIALVRACGISERNSYDQLRDRILRYFDSSMLLIVDEVHQAMIGRSLKTVTIELLREIADECGCGVVLCGTDVLPEMISDPRFRKFLGQIDNRGILRRRVPAEPPVEDVRAICTAYGLPHGSGEPWALAKRIAASAGIGKLTKYLRMSRKLASNRGEALAWEHVSTTHATLTSWAASTRPKGAENENRGEHPTSNIQRPTSNGGHGEAAAVSVLRRQAQGEMERNAHR